jgi:hypothetical protein
MQEWSEQSAFRYLFDYDRLHGLEARESTPTDTRITGSRTSQEVADLLAKGVNSLNRLSHCLRHDLNLAAVIRQLRDVMRLVHDQLDTDVPVATQFRLIYPFISWYNKNSASSYLSVSEKVPTVLLFLLHMYSAFISLAVALPATNLPLFTAFRYRAIMELNRALEQEESIQCPGCNVAHPYSELAAFPLQAVQLYRSHRAV